MIGPGVKANILWASLTGDYQSDAHSRARIDGNVQSLVGANTAQIHCVILPIHLKGKIAEVEVIWDNSPVPLWIALPHSISPHERGF
jgi:hypothetical protein